MRKILFRGTAMFLICGIPATFAQNTAKPSVPHVSGSGAARITTGMAKPRGHNERLGGRRSSIGGTSSNGDNPQGSDEGRTSGGSGGSGM